MPRVSVVIVNWNAGAALDRCLASLHEHAPAGGAEIVVVDNASTDRSATRATGAHPDITLIANPTNLGLPAANNQGIRATSGEYVLIANPDVEFGPGAIDALVEVLDRNPRAAIAVPRLLDEHGTPHTSAGDLPTLGEALLGRRAQRRGATPGGDGDCGFWWDGWAHDVERRVGRGHEAASLVRRRAIDEVGLQDERYPLDWEGIDWQARMAAAGWEVWFTPKAEVVHLGGVSIRQVPRRWIVRSHRGMYRYFADRHPWWRPWLAPVVAARAAAKLLEHATGRDVYAAGHAAGAEDTSHAAVTGPSLLRRRPPTRFLLLTPGRAGSILLLRMLAAHPEVRTDDELLGREGVALPAQARQRDPDATVARAAARAARAGATAWGWSLHPNHLTLHGIADPVGWVARFHDEGGRIVTLVRENHVHHALSAMITLASDRPWHQTAATATTDRVHLDPGTVLQTVVRMQELAGEVEGLVGERSHLALVYERDLRDPEQHQATADRVFRFLGLDPVPVEPPLARRVTPLRDQIENYDQIAGLLRATPHGRFLAEDGE